MDGNFLPVTISTEYKDISLLLSASTRGLTSSASFYILALSAFGLSYSSISTAVETLLEPLKEHLCAVNPQSTPLAEEAEAIGFAAHVFRQQAKWKRELQRHQDILMAYFTKVDNLQWLRSSAVATSFLLGFATEEAFSPLVMRAKDYLSRQLGENSGQSFPVIIFGLHLAGESSQIEISNVQIQNWLERTYSPFKYLCMLAVTLRDLQHPLYGEVVTRLRNKVLEIYSTTVDPNINTIRILLAIIHMAEMGQSADQITQALERFPVDEAVRKAVSAIIRADSRLFVEFQSDWLAQPPTVDFLAFYLFAASKLGLTKAYIIDDALRIQFSEFLKIWQHKKARAVHQSALAALILVSLAAGITLLFRIWWPFSSNLYNWTLEIIKNDLIESYLDDVLKLIIVFPVYIIVGSALALWLYGRVRWRDMSFESVRLNSYTTLKQILGQGSK